MNVLDRTFKLIRNNISRIKSGGIISIPSRFRRFRKDYVGIIKGTYTLITAATKAGKSQITNYLYLFTPILYAYHNRDKCRVKIFYYPFEEKDTDITMRFMSFLLYELSNGAYEYSPSQLSSIDNTPLPEEVLDILESPEYKNILDFYVDHVVFSDTKNPTGIYKEMVEYASNNGTIHYETYINKEGSEERKFSHYVPDDEDEYRIVIVDHVSLLSTERDWNLKQTIDKLSEYFVILRNKYGFNPVVVQQQAFNENADNYKLQKLRPTLTGCSDSKYPSRDADLTLSLFSPYKHELREYLGYDVSILKDNIRFFEVLANRHGISNGIIALEFMGNVCSFKELPPSNSADMQPVYNRIKQRNNPIADFTFLMFNKLLNATLRKHNERKTQDYQ